MLSTYPTFRSELVKVSFFLSGFFLLVASLQRLLQLPWHYTDSGSLSLGKQTMCLQYCLFFILVSQWTVQTLKMSAACTKHYKCSTSLQNKKLTNIGLLGMRSTIHSINLKISLQYVL